VWEISINVYLTRENIALIIGSILIVWGYLMDSLIGNIVGLVGLIMIYYAVFYSDLKEWIRSKRE
jgi:hypothetical protein